MTIPKSLLAAGGDLRQLTAAKVLAAEYAVTVIGFDRFGKLPAEVTAAERLQELPAQLDALLLPMPVTQEGIFLHAPFSSSTIALPALLPLVKPGGTVFGGRMTEEECRMIEAAGLHPADYAKAETFAVRNAVPTAEGAVQIAMQELPVVLQDLPCLILGAGRVSTALQPRLRALGAAVTGAARRCDDRARAEGNGCRSVPFTGLDAVLQDFPLIVNTVPVKLLGREQLRRMRQDVLVLDLSSKPGGDHAGDNKIIIKNTADLPFPLDKSAFFVYNRYRQAILL